MKNVATNLPTNFISGEILKQFKSCSKVERFKKATIDLPVLKVTFNKNDDVEKAISDGIFIGGLFIKPEAYDLKKQPVRCFICQKYNHIANNCNSDKYTCPRCGGNHDKSKNCTMEIKCSNCEGAHYASSKDCTIYLKYFKKANNIN